MILSFLAIAVCAGFPEAIGNDAAYTKAGNSFTPFYELGNRKPYLCVGQLKLGGSAVWIGGRWLLTNAHCVDWDLAPDAPKDSVTRERDRENVFTIVTSTETEQIPCDAAYRPIELRKWNSGGADLALVRLSRVPRASGVTPAIPASTSKIIGLRVVCSGYGSVGLATTGPNPKFTKPHPGLRFGFENVLDAYTNDNFVARFTFDEHGLPLEGCISPGDSGSGMFAEIEGTWKLVVVNAHSDTGPGGRFYNKFPVYGAHDGGIRIALFYPEIMQALKSDDPRPFWSLTVETMKKRLADWR